MFDAEASGGPLPLRRYWLATTEAPSFSGGIGVYTHHTALMLARGGVAVTVLHYDPAALDPVYGFRDGYRLIRFSKRDLARRPIPHANLQGPLRISLETAAVLAQLIDAESAPDVVEFQDYGAQAHAFLKHRLLRPDAAHPRVVLTAHRPHAHCALVDGEGVDEHRTAFLADAERWCYAAADAVLAPCGFIVGALKRIGFPMARAQLVANPYDAGLLAATPPSETLVPERLELKRALHTAAEPLLYFGKLQAQKGAPDLLATLDALHTEGEAPQVWLFGRDAFLSGTGTSAYDVLERGHYRLFEGGRARYFGGYGLSDLRALCAEHPIAALPYREDCLPYAFVEAVLCGALPLTSANGGQVELIPPDLRATLTVDFLRPDAVGGRLATLRALGPAARRAMSRRLQDEVSRHTDPQAVFARKRDALGRVAPSHRSACYPFVYGPSQGFAPPDPLARLRLAQAVPQRGATRSLRQAGPMLQPSPDLISVVVPYFDMHAFVDETLASIEAQDHAAVEVVIVDDGSPSPEARARIDAILAAPRRFPTRVLRKTNGGLADARNAGAKIAHGGYLYFLDADDLIHPSTLSRSLAVLKRYDNVGYVGAGLKEFGESAGEWQVFDIDGPYVAFHNLQICAFLVRAQAWLAHGVNDPQMRLGMEDYDSHIRMYAAGVRGVAIPEPLFSYRKRAGSMSKAFDAHAVASLYRRIRQSSPELFRRFGPELVGLYAENGHGALAPSIGEPSPHHTALFGRDIPALDDIAERLEAHASRKQLGRALRARCAVGGPEWDYTTARLLLALDREAAFARQLLLAAVAAEPSNGWFRLYAMIAQVRDGRLGGANALWTAEFAAFCAAEAGAVGWVGALEAVRGFPHVALVLKAWLGARADVAIAAPPPHLDPKAAAPQAGAFGAVHAALAGLHASLTAGAHPFTIERAQRQVREAAGTDLSAEAIEALLRRWRRTWTDETPRASTVWGAASPAYLQPKDRLPRGLDPLEQAERDGWIELVGGSHPAVLHATAQTLRRGLERIAPRERAEAPAR